MQTKLTLRLDDRLIAFAKEHARAQGKSLSQIVAEYFRNLQTPPGTTVDPPGSQVSALHGALQGAHLDESDYPRYLEQKHLGQAIE